MEFVNLKEMAKRAKTTEEEIMELVEIGVIKPQKSYCHPLYFGDGKAIAFIPKEALADIEVAKSKPKPKPEPEPEPEEPEEDEEEERGDEDEEDQPGDKGEEGKLDTSSKAQEPLEPKAPNKEEPKGKDKKPGKK